MAQFKRNKNHVVLDFDDVIFEVDSTSKTFFEATNKFQEMANEMQSLKFEGVETIEKFTEKLVESIDEFLGEKAVRKIFPNQKVNMYDCIDVISYILDSVQEFNQSKMAKYNPERIAR